MMREKQKKEKSNYGVAFITVDSTKAVQNAIANFKELKREIKTQDINMYKRFEVFVSF